MKLDPETIFQALFKTICSVNSPATPLKTMSRKWRKWDDVGDAPMPAFYQMQMPFDTQDQKRVFGPTRYELQALLFFYFAVSTSDPQPISPTLNTYFKAIDVAMAPTIAMGNKQNLGLGNGIENAWIRGTVAMDEGLVSPPAMLVIPVTVLTG
jgi:hypothetical protein